MIKADTLRLPTRLALPWVFPAWWCRASLFIVMILIYAFFSSSTPNEFGLPEAAIGLLLLIFVGSRGAILALGGFLIQRQNAVPPLAYWCFLVLVLVPTAWGMFVMGNQLSDYIRDAIPLLYLFLPIIFVPQMIHQRADWQKLCVTGLCVIGVAYSVRHFMSSEVAIAALAHEVIVGEKNFFMNPAVIFAATFLLTSGFIKLFEGKWLNGVLRLLLGAVPFASLIAVLLRAQIFLVLLSVFLILVYRTLRSPRMLILWVVLFCVCLLFVAMGSENNFVESLFDLIMAKSESAGVFNLRDLEAQAVINSVMSGPDKLLFGVGWGGLVDNPAAEAIVRFTHNFEMYALLKGGLIGVIFLGIYTFLNLHKYFKFGLAVMVSHDAQYLPLLLAIGNVMCVNLLIEGGYKIFSFGLVLTVLWLFHPASSNEKHLGGQLG